MNKLSFKSRVRLPALALLLPVFLVVGLAACGPAAPTADAPTGVAPTNESEPPPQETEPSPINNEDDAGDAGTVEGYPEPATTENGESYPAPVAPTATADGPYPPPTSPPPTAITSYPEPEATAANGVPFAFERPISAGDTTIRGMGPTGLEISIINITFMGEELASTVVGEDGQFEVDVPALEAGIRIGLTADLEGSDLEDQIVPGEGAMNVPQVGYYYDTVVITANS